MGESNWKMDVRCPIIISKKRVLCIWCCDYEEDNKRIFFMPMSMNLYQCKLVSDSIHFPIFLFPLPILLDLNLFFFNLFSFECPRFLFLHFLPITCAVLC